MSMEQQRHRHKARWSEVFPRMFSSRPFDCLTRLMDVQDFNADHPIVGVIIKNNTRLNLGGLDDPGFSKPQVQGVGFLVVVHFHGVSSRVAS